MLEDRWMSLYWRNKFDAGFQTLTAENMQETDMNENQILFDIKVTCNVKPDEVGFVSRCPEFDVFSQGKTEQSAIKNLKEAVELFIETCCECGTLLDVLRESGYEFSRRKPTPIKDGHMMEIPFSLVSHAQTHAN